MSRPNQAHASLHGQASAITVHDNDVLSGRGVNIAQHPGNERFRALVNTRHDENYCTAYTTTEKRAVAEEILKHIQSLDPPGRFLRRSGRSNSSRGLHGPWEQLSDREAVKKICQALRDCNRTDRTGYAASVAMPDDVRQEAHARMSLGMTNKDLAAAAAAKTLKRDVSMASSSTSASLAAPIAAAPPVAKVPIAPAPIVVAAPPVPIAMRPEPPHPHLQQQVQHIQPAAQVQPESSQKRSSGTFQEQNISSSAGVAAFAVKKPRTDDDDNTEMVRAATTNGGPALPLVTPAGGMGYASFDSFFGASYDFSLPAATPETTTTMTTTPTTGGTSMSGSAGYSFRSSMSPAVPANAIPSPAVAYEYHPGMAVPQPHFYPPGGYYMPPPQMYAPYIMHPDPLAPPSPPAEAPVYSYHPFHPFAQPHQQQQHPMVTAPPGHRATAPDMMAPLYHHNYSATLDMSSTADAPISNDDDRRQQAMIQQHQQLQDAAEAAAEAAAAAEGHSSQNSSPGNDFAPSTSPNPFDNEDEHLQLP